MDLRAVPVSALSLSILLAGCGDRTPPVLQELDITANANPSTPLAASVLIRTDEPSTVTFRIEGDGAEWNVDPGVDLASEHRIPLLGLRADTDHRIVVVATDAAGNETASEPVELRTDPLPESFPNFVLERSDPERMEPGATLFNLMRWPEGGLDDEFGAVVIVDAQGEVIWYHLTDSNVGDASLLPSGHLLYALGRLGRAVEVDMLGNVVAQWHPSSAPKEEMPQGSIEVDAEAFHHELLEMPSGNLLTLGTELRHYDEYPSSTFDPKAAKQLSSVVGDVIIEFSRDGRVRRELKLLDILDPFRTGSGSGLGGGSWLQVMYGDQARGPLVDWAHTNAVFFDAESNAFIVSVRRQDAVVKLDADSGEIVWILGAHDRWSSPWSDYLLSPHGELEWPNHQHASMVTPRGTVLMFDNGTNRDGPLEERAPASDNYSRAVEYEIDEEAMEVRQVWEYRGGAGAPFYSSFISDADWLPVTGNVLITAGGLIADASGMATEGSRGLRSARIMEVTHEPRAEIVFELLVEAEWPAGGWHVYRAQRIPSLYGAPISSGDRPLDRPDHGSN
ncbi:MAG: aryl-sulfate sulfotransferase [Gemmatimonadetes bacterium]|nr:aryl-sulfate sulfotransferase [Gemmatimonadota bacterium]